MRSISQLTAFYSGEIKFEEKALNCEASNGSAAVIYNNAPGLIGGTLIEFTEVSIPVVEIRQIAGKQFLDTTLGRKLTLELKPGYGFKSGKIENEQVALFTTDPSSPITTKVPQW